MIFAIGAFDGFHLGHMELLKAAKKRAKEKRTGWGVITFDAHPQQIFNKNRFKLLFSSEERDALAKFAGIEVMDKIQFTHTLADMSPREFIAYIESRSPIEGIVVGENFRFGKARTGTPKILKDICREKCWCLDVIPPFKLEGEIISSTAIREALIRGRVEKAGRMLGYPFFISGRVIRGDGQGKKLGYPTANMMVKSGKVYPEHGSYSALTYIDGRIYTVALNIGYNPTFKEIRSLRCEAHLIGYNSSLYGKLLLVMMIDRIRGEVKFSTADELKARLNTDIRLIKSTAASYLSKGTNASVIEQLGQILL